MAIIIRRFFELLIPSVLFSYGVICLRSFGLLSGSYYFIFGSIFAPTLFVLINVLSMRSCYMFLLNKQRFYIYNYISYLLFMLVTIAVQLFFGENVYTGFFGITKLMIFSGSISGAVVFVFHLIMIFIIGIVPVTMRYENAYNEEYMWVEDVFGDESEKDDRESENDDNLRI